jgi:hypothetical protein
MNMHRNNTQAYSETLPTPTTIQQNTTQRNTTQRNTTQHNCLWVSVCPAAEKEILPYPVASSFLWMGVSTVF